MTKLSPIHEPSLAFVAPGSFSIGEQNPVRVVLHDTECHDAAGISEIQGVVAFWMRTELPGRLGAHYIVDADGNVGRCGTPDQILQHVGGLNGGSVGIEQIGFASFTEKDWLDRPKQLERVARILAWLHEAYKIPLAVPSPQRDGLLMRGVMTHAMVSRFEPASLGHTDPGAGYPLAHVLARAKQIVDDRGWIAGTLEAAAASPVKVVSTNRVEVTWIARNGKPRSQVLSPGTNPYRWLWTHHPRSWRRGQPRIRLIHETKGNA